MVKNKIEGVKSSNKKPRNILAPYLFKLIRQTNPDIPDTFGASRANYPVFILLGQKGLKPIISLTSLKVFEALSLAFSAPSLTTLRK